MSGTNGTDGDTLTAADAPLLEEQIDEFIAVLASFGSLKHDTKASAEAALRTATDRAAVLLEAMFAIDPMRSAAAILAATRRVSGAAKEKPQEEKQP